MTVRAVCINRILHVYSLGPSSRRRVDRFYQSAPAFWRVLLGADRIGRPRPDLDLAIGPFDPNLDRARIYQAERCRERDLGGVTRSNRRRRSPRRDLEVLGCGIVRTIKPT